MKLLCISLGCDKNLVDAERMLGSLSQDGYTFTDDEQEADVILVNTCCFINDAKEESVNTILEMAEYKKSGTCKALLVSGCMAQRYKEEILQEVPEVDGILGTTSYDEVSKVLAEALKGERVSDFHDLSELPETKMRSKRLVTTGGHYAFLKISEGCNKRCTYCIIPSLRGPYRSVPMEQLLAEAKELADQGVKELILVTDRWNRMDPYPVLLSGGDHRGVDSGDQDGGKSLSLPGYSDPARERCRSQADGTPHESGGASGADRASAGRDPRYCTPHDLNFRFPG